MQSKKTKKDDIYNGDHKYKCSACGRHIGEERYLRCTRDIGQIICMECFSNSYGCAQIPGVQGMPKVYHEYMIMDPDPKPILRSDWDSNEEIILLNAIRLLGIGNWNTIAEWLKPRTAAEIEAHYFQTYIETETNPLPQPVVLPPAVVPPPPTYSTKPQESCPSEGHDKIMREKNKKERTTPAEHSGWMPYRREFEADWNNDAEELVANIEFDANETQSSFEDKIKNLQLYNIQLRERHANTKIIEDWDVHHLELRNGGRTAENDLEACLLNSSTKEQRLLDSKLLPLAPYRSKEELKELAEDLHTIDHCTEQIERRFRWQMNGITSAAEGALFDELSNIFTDPKRVTTDAEIYNRTVEAYTKKYKKDAAPNRDSLSPAELDLCTREKIPPQEYSAIKDLLVRESGIRRFDREAAIAMSPCQERVTLAVYDLLHERFGLL